MKIFKRIFTFLFATMFLVNVGTFYVYADDDSDSGDDSSYSDDSDDSSDDSDDSSDDSDDSSDDSDDGDDSDDNDDSDDSDGPDGNDNSEDSNDEDNSWASDFNWSDNWTDEDGDLDEDEAETDAGKMNDDGTLTVTYSDGDDARTWSYDSGEREDIEGQASALTSHVNECAELLNAAKDSGDPAAIAAAQAEYDAALGALNAFCENHSYFETIVDAAGFVTTVDVVTGTAYSGVGIVGDPVKLSTGEFSIQDFDLVTSFFGKTYKITRNYRTHGKNGGVFGNGWNSNLDMRLVHCTHNDLTESISYYESWKVELESIKEELEGYYDEEEESPETVKETLDEFLELYNGVISELEKLQARQRKTEYFRQFQKYTNYGELEESCKNLGNNIVLFTDESGVIYVFEKKEEFEDELEANYETENAIFYPRTKNLYFERLDFDAETQIYTMHCTNGDKFFFDKYGLHTKTEYKNIKIEKKYEFDNDDKISALKIAINGKNLYDLKFDSAQRIVSAESLGEKNTYGYNPNGFLSSVTDRWGNTRAFEYNGNNFLSKQIFADGSFRTVTYDDTGKVRIVTDENGNSEYFDYDIENRITYYTDRDGIQSTYFYDENLNTIKEIYADGDIKTFEYNEKNEAVRRNRTSGFETIEYDDKNHVTKVTYADGKTQEYVYNEENLIAIKDRDGYSLYFEYDAGGNVTSLSNGSETVFTATFDENGLMTSRSDCRNNTAYYTYDLNGNMTKKTIRDSKGATIYTEEKYYDGENRLTRLRKSDGKTVTFSYGNNDSLTALFSDGLKVEYEYNKRGRLSRICETDTFTGKKREATFTYDRAGNLIEKSVNGVKTMGWTYTAGGKLAKSIIYNPIFDESKNYGPKTWETEFSYDETKGTVSSINELALGNSGRTLSLQATALNFERTSGGSQSSFTLDDGRTIIQKFNDNGNLIEKIANTVANGAASRTSKSVYSANFSSEGRILSESERNGFGGEYYFDYEGFGHISKCFENGESETGILNENKIEYFADGLVSATTDPSGIRTSFSYDGFGNVIEKRNPYTIVKYEYNGKNCPIKTEVFDAKSGKTVWKATYQYGKWNTEAERWILSTVGDKITTKIYFNAWGELVSKVDASGNTTTYEINEFGECVKTTLPSGITENSKYDGRGFLVEQIIIGKSGTKLTANYEYDFHGNLVAAYTNSRLTYKAKYDSTNRKIFEHSSPFAKYNARNYEYDEFDRVVKITLGDETVPKNAKILLERYEYNAGTSAKIIRYDAKQNAQIISIDKFGRTLIENNRLGDSQSFIYKKDGTVAQKTDFLNQKITLSGSEKTLESKASYFDGTKVEYTYDNMGRILRVKNDVSDFSYKYDSAGFLTSVRDEKKGTEVQYFYNELGLRTEIKGEQTHIKYFYNKSGWLSSVYDVKGQSEVKFAYDDLGRETLKVWSNGKSQKYDYDSEGRRIATCGFDARLQVIFFDGAVFDENGFKILKIDGDGSVTQYKYDEYGRLSTAIYPYSESLLKSIKNELSENGIFFHENKISSEERISISQSEKEAAENILRFMGINYVSLKTYENTLFEKFSYDENGNLTLKETPFAKIAYNYDAEDRLISFGNSGNAAYDKNGNLISQKNSWKAKYFEYNAQNRVKKAGVDDFKTGETVIYNYSYDGFGRKLEETSTKSGGSGRRYFYDGFSLKKLYSTPIIFSSLSDNSTQKRDATRALKSETSSTSSDRYAWFYDKESASSKSASSAQKTFDGYTRYVFGNDATPLMSMTAGSLSFENENYSLFDDLSGSVCKISNELGNNYSANYTGFGAVYDTDFPTSQNLFFIGKEYNGDLENYDFGYRDYDGKQGRFQTVDPIRDGENWYMYCGGNPISFFDPNGLWVMTPAFEEYMQSGGEYIYINDTQTTTYKEGCVCQAIASIINSFTGLYGVQGVSVADIANGLDPRNIFDSAENHKPGDKFDESDLIIDQTLSNYGYTMVADTGRGASTSAIIDSIESAKNSSIGVAVMAQVTTGTSKHDDGTIKTGDHTVLVSGIVEQDGKTYVSIVATSMNDRAGIWHDIDGKNSARYDLGWIITKDGLILVPIELVDRTMSVIRSSQKFNYELSKAKNH